MKFDKEEVMRNAEKMSMPKSAKFIDINKIQPLGCLLWKLSPNVAPDDQSPCIKMDCENCGEPIWVSEKKRILRKSILNSILTCHPCHIINLKLHYNDDY